MPAVIPIAALAISAAGTAYSAVSQKRAAENAAQVDTATAAYNARMDRAQGQQIALDAQQNIRTERQNDASYLSRQAASYAASGVLSTTGSPLHAQITNAGRMEQKIQQQWQDAQVQEEQLYSQAAAGIAGGNAMASADEAQGNIAMIDGGAKIAGEAFQAYSSGVFSG